MAGKFEIKTGKTGKFSFNLKASNGQVILSSESYDSRKGAEGGIASVKKNAGNDARFERKTAKDGSAYFVLKASNGEVVGNYWVLAALCARYFVITGQPRTDTTVAIAGKLPAGRDQYGRLKRS